MVQQHNLSTYYDSKVTTTTISIINSTQPAETGDEIRSPSLQIRQWALLWEFLQ